MTVRLEVEDGIALITLNRPDRLNALDRSSYHELSRCWIQVRDDPGIRVAVVTGNGRAFCVGADLKEAADSGGRLDPDPPLLNNGLQLWKPVVAAVNGFCYGGGLTMLLATDIRVAAESASFRLPEVPLGLLPGNGGTQRILRQLPRAAAMGLLWGVETWDASHALSVGLVTEVVRDDDLLPRALEVARSLAALPAEAAQEAKRLALESRMVGLEEGLRLELMSLTQLREIQVP